MKAESALFLAVETSTLTQSLALCRGPELLAERELELPRGHAAVLLRSVHELLAEQRLGVADLDALVVGLGPGSFTGLRISLASLKGLALAFEKPLYGVSSLWALAYRVKPADALVCACTDARKGEVYAALFKPEGEEWLPLRLSPDEAFDFVLPPRELADRFMFVEPTRPIVFVGTGAQVYEQSLRASMGERAHFALEALAPSAVHVARLALPLLASPAPSLATLEPRYIRPSEAELH
ncbi:MAG: tRNA (adenosine(37)-N6)-threonylcarbamoyltransferase complex dimerization subunit type 1 TsaB [Myxococcota bacterium]|jgi:tRNA threonylcarbamoyladenosine biosynthesis protein TsaB|nr:tRNA (adenosine(37)-N6)-threonylcarbamoyltransferase complex dimerization subunit type 1 TsaB [Myxococcota bacterium]